MAKLLWTEQLSIGIEVIDQQHRRIVDYINQLEDARARVFSQEEFGGLITELVDYTVSHFGFEESLQEEAGYPYIKAHKRVHELFTRRIGEFQARFDQGEDVSTELNNVLVTWLSSHIQRDDEDYAETVKQHLSQQHDFVEKKKGLFSLLFG
jgi:hemerythrin